MSLQRIVPSEYESQLAAKIAHFKQNFAGLNLPEASVFRSEPTHYRLRAEFRIFHSESRVDYAMFAADDPKRPVVIADFPVASTRIGEAMPLLRDCVSQADTLKKGLFQANFLSTLSGELLITLIYHRRLDQSWEDEAKTLASQLNAQIVGRSRHQKIILDRDWVLEKLDLNDRTLRYQQIEGSFTQPNGAINRQMLAWACTQAEEIGGDLLELYCGNGNFTIALAPMFERILATEISKSSVKAAHFNLAANSIENVRLVRMSSDEISSALAGERLFNRLKDIDLSQYRFSTLFVDPPRSGLDAGTIALARGFRRILYISCNPATLHENLAALHASHEISSAALFDQFPYTDHMECGVLLKKRVAS